MKLNPSEYNRQTIIFWSIMLTAALCALGFAVYEITAFSSLQFITLGAAIAVTVVLSQHQIKIPGTQINFSAKEAVAFWGAVWLGIPGGVLLAAAASLAGYKFASKDKKEWLFNVSLSIVSIFAAAGVFYFMIGGVDYRDHANAGWLLTAAGLMAVTHFVINFLMFPAFLSISRGVSILWLWRDNTVWTGIIYLSAFICAGLLYISLDNFGLSFGLVILPIVVAGHLVYKFYLNRLAQKTAEIREASRIHLATVEALATAIDARDQVGVGHVRRTQIYAVGIGEILGLPEGDIQALRTGALLHDIGKLGVPDHILNKPGKLTSAEMEKMKIHSTVGASILEKVGFPYPVVPTVKHHHEMWNGTGYPDGLKGENIPLTARIIAVADAYDTLRGARPYRAAVSRDQARKFLLHGAGTQFDPRIVDIFLRNLKRFEDRVELEGLSYSFDSRSALLYITDESDGGGFVQQIKRANREVFMLYELAKVFGSSVDAQGTFNLFAKKIGELVPFDSCIIYLLDEAGEEATATFASGKNSEQLQGRKVKIGEGATGNVLKDGESIYQINPGMDFSFYENDFIEEYSAMISLPLLAGENLLGAVSLYSCELENYGEEHLRLLETVSRIASDAIYKSLQHAETENRALTDPMTGLPNGRSLQIQFEKEIARANRGGSTFQVLMLDLDGFKAVNDNFGHRAGDKMLREISRIMRGELRDYDFLARYAGDEFVAIIPETDDDSVKDLCSRLENAVAGFSLPVEGGRFARVGISIGTACYPQNGESLDQIVVAADKEMYHVKAMHKRKRKAERISRTSPTAPSEAIKISNGEIVEDGFIVELDERHIISSAIN